MAAGNPSPLSGGADAEDHRCTSCGRRCRLCAELKPCAKASWCRWCMNAYADNPPAEDGRVYCAECGAQFPGLPELIAAGLSTYPKHCRQCREERRDAAAAERELNARVGAESVVAAKVPTSRTRTNGPQLPAGPPAAYREEQAAARAQREPGGGGVTGAASTTSVPDQIRAAEKAKARAKAEAASDPDTLYLRGGFRPRDSTPWGVSTGRTPDADDSELGTGSRVGRWA